ncbi:MAG: RecX family transcriptional regulator [Bacteroidetes bacterium]|nr:RecX family transcriptional regulator [Bacteroidota bacterium]
MGKSDALKSNLEQELFDKVARFCAYQPRYSREVVEKLKQFGANQQLANKISNKLQEYNYFNDSDFAHSFAIGKNRNNHWGKVKILLELKYRGIDESVIKSAIDKIDDDDYQQILTKIAGKKLSEIKVADKKLKFQKALQYLIGKGYENDISIRILKDLTADK